MSSPKPYYNYKNRNIEISILSYLTLLTSATWCDLLVLFKFSSVIARVINNCIDVSVSIKV